MSKKLIRERIKELEAKLERLQSGRYLAFTSQNIAMTMDAIWELKKRLRK